MSNYSQPTKRNVEAKNDANFLDGMSNDSRELFKHALSEAMNEKSCKIEKETRNMEITPYSKRHKIRMNRFFRENVGGSFLPFPEADNLYERVRSKLVIKFKINEFIDRHKERK